MTSGWNLDRLDFNTDDALMQGALGTQNGKGMGIESAVNDAAYNASHNSYRLNVEVTFKRDKKNGSRFEAKQVHSGVEYRPCRLMTAEEYLEAKRKERIGFRL